MAALTANDVSLKTVFLGVELESPIWNASGPRCTTKEELDALGESKAGMILTKSVTVEARAGNPEPRYASFPGGSINSMGLPNLGIEEYLEILPMLSKHRKPVIVSLSGLSLADNLAMATRLAACQPRPLAIELNLSCPNIIGKPQVGYDFEQSAEVVGAFGELCRQHGLVWGAKLPPYFDFAHFGAMAHVLNASSAAYVTCINSPGNGLVVDPHTEATLIRPKGGFGGIGGPIIKPFGLANVRKMRELLRADMHVVGVGGIATGTDVFEYMLCGATAVQVGTQLWEEGPGVFSRLAGELREVLSKKGYSDLDACRGKLKVI
eukprot:comp23123_c0_seq1/m.37257 comp23123_c0_seq1/g.37257  ORF comp23123_c0_seq1/g.37257 comp23123_c0_seq1/m.37257 type:complete len:322 (-) comp23123_c0_seq1:497-1462(-)